jgi:hypothetical protein
MSYEDRALWWVVVVVAGVRRGKLEFWKNDVGKSSLYPAVFTPDLARAHLATNNVQLLS